MNILLIGPGSIGTRHLQNLVSLGYTNLFVVSHRSKLPGQLAPYPVYATVTDALAKHPYDVALVCNPTAFHVPVLLQLLQHQVPAIYIEKPVSHSVEQLETVLALAGSYPNKIVVGFDLHFDPGLQKVKQLMDEQVIGPLVSVNAQVGQYLPDWRPTEDHRAGMSAKKETGGGVLLDLVHEFDYLRWLCGPVQTLAALSCNTGHLQIETEEVAEVLLRFSSGAIGTIHLDYLQPTLVRNCLLTGQLGTITWDLANNQVTWTDRQKQQQQFNYQGYQRNQRFIDSMQAFLQPGFDYRLTTLAQGIESLALVLAAKKSCESQQFESPHYLLQNLKTIAQ